MDIVEWLRDAEPELYGKRCKEAADEIERLREAWKIAVVMRQAQKTYFKDRNQQNLIASKQAEKAFDEVALQQKDSE